MQPTKLLALGALSAFLMLSLPGCEAVRRLSAVKAPESQTSAQAITEAACRVPPKRLTQLTPVPVVCFLRDNAVNDDMWACIEGYQGTADNPQSGALAQCNADKAAIEAMFRAEED